MKAYWAEPLLRDQHVLSRAERLARHSEVLPPVLVFGSEGWALGKEVLKKLHHFEGHLLRNVCMFKREPGHDLKTHLSTSARKARTLYIKLGHARILERVLRNHHRVAASAGGRVGPDDLTWAPRQGFGLAMPSTSCQRTGGS